MNNTYITRYLKTVSAKNTFIKVDIYYNLGGYNCFTSNQEKRGIFVDVCPIEKNGVFEIYQGFSGVKYCLQECKRKPKTAKNIDKTSLSNIIDNLITYILQGNNNIIIDMDTKQQFLQDFCNNL